MKTLVCLCLLISACGSSGGSTSSRASTPPVAPPSTSPISVVSVPAPITLLPMNYALKHETYIISGQSNATRLLYAIAGINTDSTTQINDLSAGTTLNVFGYPVGGTNIDYWLDSTNQAPLLLLLTTKCSLNPYLVWDQGQSDSMDDPNVYRTKLITFFNVLITQCPNIAIIEVGMAVNQAYIDASNANQIRQVQIELGTAYIDEKPFGDQYGYLGNDHLLEQGYINFWATLISQFPLT